MSDIPRIGSTEFRVRYKELKELTEVTVLGQTLGWWYPARRPEPPKVTLRAPLPDLTKRA